MIGCDSSWEMPVVGQGELENAESFQWWHQERRQELGVGVPKLSCLRELSQGTQWSMLSSSFLFSMFLGRRWGEGEGEEVLKTLANWRRTVWGTCKFVLIIFPYFGRGTSISVQACFRKSKLLQTS